MYTQNLTAWLSLGVAALAVVLSQFPPLMTYYASPEFELVADSPINVSHNLGEIVLSPYLQIKNSGDAEGTVSKIELIVSKKGDSSFKKGMRAQIYYLKPSAISPGQLPVQIPFSNISIQPGETWEAYVDFFKAHDVSRRGKIAEFRERVSSEFLESQKQRSNKQGIVYFEPPTISDDLFNRIKSHTEKELSPFVIGQYSLHLKLYSKSDQEPDLQKCYLFTVFEGDLREMDRITGMYRTGLGIISPYFHRIGFPGDITKSECLN